MWKIIVALVAIAAVESSPIENGVAENFVGAVSECIESDTSLCLKVKSVLTFYIYSEVK